MYRSTPTLVSLLKKELDTFAEEISLESDADLEEPLKRAFETAMNSRYSGGQCGQAIAIISDSFNNA